METVYESSPVCNRTQDNSVVQSRNERLRISDNTLCILNFSLLIPPKIYDLILFFADSTTLAPRCIVRDPPSPHQSLPKGLLYRQLDFGPRSQSTSSSLTHPHPLRFPRSTFTRLRSPHSPFVLRDLLQLIPTTHPKFRLYAPSTPFHSTLSFHPRHSSRTHNQAPPPGTS